MTAPTRLEDVARRLGALPRDKQAEFLAWLDQRGISVLSLPIVPQPRPPAIPLSFAQRRLWLLAQLQPESAQYNIPRIYALTGALDVPALTRAVHDLLARHEGLRTTFSEGGGEPAQIIQPPPAIALVAEDVTADAARALADAEATRPFDLARGPLLRTRLLRLAPDRHWLLVTSHHIVMDEWSDAILARELVELYDAHHHGRAPRLAPPAIQYADYAIWQRRWLTDERLAQQLAYWQAELGSGEHAPALPPDARGTGDHADAHRFRLPAALEARLRSLAARANTTLFTTLLAVFQLVLHRFSGQREIRIGAPIANRNRRETEGVVGCFANTQVLRAVLSPAMSFAGHLEAVKRTSAAAQSHQDVPFDRVVEALAPSRAIGETPLFQVMFSWHRGRTDRAAAGALGISQEAALDRSAKFDLVLHMTDDDPGVSGELLYRTAVFTPATIASLAARFERLAAAAVDAPDRPLRTLAWLSDAERAQVTQRWNATDADHPTDSLHDIVARWARTTPEAPAVQHEDARLSYGALDDRAARIAGVLIARGVRPDDRVGLCLPRSLELIAGLLGILTSGAAYVPLDPRTPPARLRQLLADAGIMHVLAVGETAAQLRALGVGVLDDLDPAHAPARVSVAPDGAAYVIYTSGSTGRPKGVVVSHRAITSYAHGVLARLVLPAGATMALVSTPTADLGHTVLFGALVSGGLLHVVAEDRCFDPDRMAAYLRANPVDVLKITPSHLGGLLQAASPADVLPRHTLVLGGEAAPDELLARIRALAACRIVNHYGPTEATVGAVTYEARGDEPRLPLGRPLPARQAYVLDGELAPVPPGVYGELYLGGTGVARGYLGRPDATADRLVPDPFRPGGGRLYRTGDRARFAADGNLELSGRLDDQIKLRGHRVEPGEIRAALLAAPGVRDAHVMLREAATGPRLVAYLLGAGDSSTVLAALAAWLPDHMIPADLVWLASFPLTANGKLDRRALPEPGKAIGTVAPRGAIEHQIAAAWREVLQLAAVGVDDNFFTLGGDSLLAFQVVARLRKAGLRLTIPQLFAHQTIAQLARVAQPAAAPAMAAPATGDVALTPVQRWFFDHALARPAHYNQSVLLALRAPIAPAALEAALGQLVAHHDGLRLRFRCDDGTWRQAYAPHAPAMLTVATGALADEVDQAQRSLDLADGPVLRAVLFTDRLLLVAHHLVVDGVSWRILLEDLALVLAGQPPVPATSSYQAWAAVLAAYAPEDAAYWHAQLDAAPPVRDETGNTVGSTRTASVVFDEAETAALLTRAPAAYRTRIDDLLLTALALTLCEHTGADSAAIQLEHHGREPLFDHVDVSRTVGWFTATYPLRLTPAAELGASIRHIKEQLRAVPRGGVGYGVLRYLGGVAFAAPPTLTFNYLGQFDQVLDGPFGAAPESIGGDRDPDAPRDRWLDVIGLVEGGRLHVDWQYSPALHAPAEVEQLAQRFAHHLRAVIAHCDRPRGATPSDFALAGLDQAELDGLLTHTPLARIADILPLTPLQEGILFHCLAAPGDGLYLTQRTIALELPIDLEALRAAWQDVAAAHDVLRTGFVIDGLRRPVQVVWRDATVAVERATGALDDVLAADRARGFDLAHPPLMRVTLLAQGPTRSQLIWTDHHLLLDGWSAWRVLSEVLARYQAIVAGAPLAIARSAPSRDHLAWLAGLDHAQADAYWRAELATATPTHVAAHVPAGDLVREELALSVAASEQLRSFAQSHALTLNTLVQGALAIVVGAVTGSADVVLGVTVSGRSALPTDDDRVGLFINTLPLRVALVPATPIVDWLHALQTRNAAMREHEHTPLARAQRGCATRGALFDTLLVFENYPIDRNLGPAADQLGIGAATAHERTNYPLALEVAPGERLRLQLDARIAPARAFVERVGDVLAQLSRAPRLADIAIASPAERAQLAGWNRTDTPPPPRTTHALFEAQVDRSPDAIAVIDRDRRASYAGLEARANQLAWRLIDAGVGPESLVAICAPRSLELIVGLLAIWKAGAGYLPIDPDYPAPRIAHMLDDARPAVVLGGGSPGAWSLDDDHGAARGRPPARARAANLAYCIYTSGSTGTPKAVAVAHASLTNFLAALERRLAFDAGDGFLALTSLSFDIAALELWLPLTRGARVVIAEREDAGHAERLLERLARGEVTVVQATPTTWRTLAATGSTVPASARVLCGGEAMPPDLAAQLCARAARVINVYGPTETTVWSTLHALDAADPVPSIGRPIDNTAAHVLDGALRPVPPGAPGELYLGGLGLARGYLRRPALTAERFVPDPFSATPGARMYRTGDLARHRADGTLDCLGRTDDQIKLRGHRIELGELEARLRAEPGVDHAAVALRRIAGEPALVAYVVADRATEPALRAAMQNALPAAMQPRHYVFVAALPRTANGKLDRKALPEPLAAPRPPRVAPRDAREHAFAAIWQRVLGTDALGVDDDLFALGGDSLAVLQIVAAARAADLALTARDVFEHPTIAQLATRAAPIAVAPAAPVTPFEHVELDAAELGDLLKDLT